MVTQASKLGLTERTCLRLDDPSPDWRLEVPHVEPSGEAVAMVIAFFRRAAELSDRLPGLADEVFPSGTVWAAWPRRAAGHTSDITDQAVRSASIAVGLVDVKVAALDTDWSALKLVWRKHLRAWDTAQTHGGG